MDSVVEWAAFRRGEDEADEAEPTCESYNNGKGPYYQCCAACQWRLYRIAQAREHHRYRVRDLNGNVIVADWVI